MSHSILIVDDDDSLRNLLSMILSRVGYTTYEVGNGQEAIEFLELEVPDLFIVDVMMPGMTGFELAKLLRADERTAQHPVIMLSALVDNDNMQEGLNSGANVYLNKPVSSQDIIAHIEALFAVAGKN